MMLSVASASVMAATPPRSATTAASAPQHNASYIDSHGTAHVSRLVPVPKTISAQAQAFLAQRASDAPDHSSVAQQRRAVDAWQAGAAKDFLKRYPATVRADRMAGVPVRVVTPMHLPAAHRDYVLMNLHGGGFVVDSGSFTESIPLAHLTRTKVVSVLYPLAPEHPFPAALDAAVAVYKQLLKRYPARHIVIYGSSAGAALTGEVAAELKRRHLPEPAALGIFAGFADFSHAGDSQSLFGLNGLSGTLDKPKTGQPLAAEYVGKTNPRNPRLSPLFSHLYGLPPTLFLTSTRDLLLSGTTIMERAFRHAGIDTRLIVFEALPHTFWNNPQLPESQQAFRDMAAFFTCHLYGHADIAPMAKR
ncbi:alpha/beta hydrolase [Oleiagrimonas sp. C23AA]|nr:alpha/beta hydrolase [Oleiagrimonas sp. C23AA]